MYSISVKECCPKITDINQCIICSNHFSNKQFWSGTCCVKINETLSILLRHAIDSLWIFFEILIFFCVLNCPSYAKTKQIMKNMCYQPNVNRILLLWAVPIFYCQHVAETGWNKYVEIINLAEGLCKSRWGWWSFADLLPCKDFSYSNDIRMSMYVWMCVWEEKSQ